MNANLSQPDFFVSPAYPQLAITYVEVPILTDPYCQAFIEAMASILVHLQQGNKPHGQERDQAQG